jgi:hypothetical protein
MELKLSIDEPLPKEKSGGRKKNCKSLEEFISHTESAIYKIKPNT